MSLKNRLLVGVFALGILFVLSILSSKLSSDNSIRSLLLRDYVATIYKHHKTDSEIKRLKIRLAALPADGQLLSQILQNRNGEIELIVSTQARAICEADTAKEIVFVNSSILRFIVFSVGTLSENVGRWQISKRDYLIFSAFGKPFYGLLVSKTQY